MSQLLVDLDLIEEGSGKNPFDELMSKIENLSLKGILTLDKNEIEKKVLFLERKCQDFRDQKSDKSKVILQAVNALSATLEENNAFGIGLAEDLYKVIGITNYMEYNESNPANYFLVNQLTNSDPNTKQFTSLEISNAIKSIYSKIKIESSYPRQIDEWLIELNFNTPKDENHMPLEFLHTFIEGLNKIEGVKVTLEDIRIGSISAKIKAFFETAKSKEEVKELLESARKFAKGRLEKDFSERERNSAETKKAELESKILEEELKGIESPLYYEQKKLEGESLKLDVERKRLENEREKISLFRERKNLLKEMLVEGIIQQRDFEMLIKGLPFIKIVNGHLTIGENIDVIDDL